MKEIKSLTAVKGIAAEEITAEQVDALNAELAEKGFNIKAIAAVEVDEAAEQTALEEANASVATLTAELEASQAEVQTLTHDIATLKNPAGAEGTEQGAEEDEISTADKSKYAFDNTPSARVLKENGLI